MNELADTYAPHGVGSVFLYTNEAHPGESYPALRGMSQKLANAREMRDRRGVSRQILADCLDGACHRTYGGLPNMTWVFNTTGTVLYKSDWTDVASVRSALDYLVETGNRRRAGEKLVGFRVERFDYRQRDRERFYELLAECGPSAVQDFEQALGPDWAK